MSTKAERREAARRERLALQRRMAMRRRLGRVAGRVAIVLAVLGGAAGILLLTRHGSPKTGPVYVTSVPTVDPSTLPGVLTGPAPWPANAAAMKERLSALGLPALSAEGTTLHIHQHLDLFVDGREQTVPAGIGIQTSPQLVFSPIHTHDISGIIHVESPTIRAFTLGEFFDVWGVRFTRSCVGGYCALGEKTLRVYVDGQLATGDPTLLKLFAHEEIVVAYGTSAQLPNPIPSSYTFPVGL